MANVLGLGVFGTFGQPHGFQQAFNADVQFMHSLDLNSSEIELFPNTELFAVKREVVRGVYSLCFCRYSYAREMNANRSTTFLGSCIVLQQVYIDAADIYKLLRELHDDLVNNAQNVTNNTIQVRQAVNLVVREPAQFQSIKQDARSIEETPFYSAKVDPQKKYFVQTEHIESTSQVITFFEEAIKNYNDTEALYFSFSEKVINAVVKKGTLKNISWDEYVNYKNLVKQDVVRTKKGLKPVPQYIPSIPVIDEPPVKQAAPVTVPTETMPVEVVDKPPVEPATAITEQPEATPVITPPAPTSRPVPHDPDFPFDGWGEPNGAWAIDEVIKKVHEYNRLLEYAKHVNTRNEDLLEAQRKIIAAGSATASETTVADTPQDRPYPGEMNAATPRQQEPGENDIEEKEPFYRNQYFPLIAFGALLLIMLSFYLIVNKRIFRKPIPSAYDIADTTTAQPADTPILTAPPSSYPDTNTQNKKDTTAAAQAAVTLQNIKPLNPLSNTELTMSEAMLISKEGIKNKSLAAVTAMVFQKFPVYIGDVYKHQYDDYAMNLMAANKNAFQKNGAGYICISDTLLHIPAYKSPRVPVAFPK